MNYPELLYQRWLQRFLSIRFTLNTLNPGSWFLQAVKQNGSLYVSSVSVLVFLYYVCFVCKAKAQNVLHSVLCYVCSYFLVSSACMFIPCHGIVSSIQNAAYKHNTINLGMLHSGSLAGMHGGKSMSYTMHPSAHYQDLPLYNVSMAARPLDAQITPLVFCVPFS